WFSCVLTRLCCPVFPFTSLFRSILVRRANLLYNIPASPWVGARSQRGPWAPLFSCENRGSVERAGDTWRSGRAGTRPATRALWSSQVHPAPPHPPTNHVGPLLAH